MPDFETEKNVVPTEESDTDYLTELQRQLEMEKNLHIVQDEQINSLKIKCDQITNEKDDLEREIEGLRADLALKGKEIKELRQNAARIAPISISASAPDENAIKFTSH